MVNVSGQVYVANLFTPNWYYGLTPGQFMVSNAIGTIGDLCRFIIPLIIYRSLPLAPPANTTAVEAIPSETT